MERKARHTWIMVQGTRHPGRDAWKDSYCVVATCVAEPLTQETRPPKERLRARSVEMDWRSSEAWLAQAREQAQPVPQPVAPQPPPAAVRLPALRSTTPELVEALPVSARQQLQEQAPELCLSLCA